MSAPEDNVLADVAAEDDYYQTFTEFVELSKKLDVLAERLRFAEHDQARLSIQSEMITMQSKLIRLLNIQVVGLHDRYAAAE